MLFKCRLYQLLMISNMSQCRSKHVGEVVWFREISRDFNSLLNSFSIVELVFSYLLLVAFPDVRRGALSCIAVVHSDATWASWPLRSPVTGLFLPTCSSKQQKPHHISICERYPSATSGSPSQYAIWEACPRHDVIHYFCLCHSVANPFYLFLAQLL